MSNPWINPTQFIFAGSGGYTKESVDQCVSQLQQRITDLEQRLKKSMASKDAYVVTLHTLTDSGALTRDEVMAVLEPARKEACKEYGITSIE